MIRYPPLPRSHHTVFVVGFVCLLTTFAGIVFVAARNDTAGPMTDARARIAPRFGRLPLSFEINKGQSHQSVKFLSHGRGYDLFLTSTEAVLTLQKPRTSPPIDAFKQPEPEVREGSVMRLKIIGANAAPRVEGQDELPGKVNYFIGNDPERWRRNIPTYRKVHYKDVYPGIDVVYYGNQGELEYDFVVAAGANPKVIKFKVEGADRIRLDETGDLVLALTHGEVRLKKPLIYQLTAEGERRDVKGTYVVNGNEISFKVRGFDAKKPLVIDPVLSYSTYLGAGSSEQAFGIAVDSQGSAYVTGVTGSTGFPTTSGAFKTTGNFGDSFVTKLDPTGSSLVYSTYLNGSGGSGSTTANAIAVDSAGNAHVTGFTSATDFPLVNPLKTSSNFFKSTDAAANWNNQNTGLVGDQLVIAPARNAPNIIYAGAGTGIHRSTDGGTTWTKLPTQGIGFPSTIAVDPTNSSVVYVGLGQGGLIKTIDGGNNWTEITTLPISFSAPTTIAIDPATPSTLYVTTNTTMFRTTDSGNSWTQLTNFGIPNTPFFHALAIDPTTPSTIYAGTGNNGVLKTTNGGNSWTPMNTGLGNNPSVIAIAIDPSNSSTLYTGHLSGGINKSTDGAASWSPVNNGVPAGQINSIFATASAVYAAPNSNGLIKTTNGGTSWTSANAGLGSNNVRVISGHPTDASILYAGVTASFAQDAFVTKLNSTGSGLLFSTYLGGSLSDSGNGIAVDGSGNIYLAGATSSKNFPAVNAFQPAPVANDFCGNGFITKLNAAVPSYVFSTYLGGKSCDTALAVAIDSAADVYVTGGTGSTDFPTSVNAFQTTHGDQFTGDAFVTKFTTSGSFSYSTFLGGNGNDLGAGVGVDSSGNAHVTGTTASTNFPTANPIQPTSGGFSGDAFVTKVNSQGSALIYSTYLGGSNSDGGRGIAVDSAGNAYVTGFTGSPEFPVLAGALRTKSPIFKSVDAGTIWTNDNYGLRTSSVTQILVHPTQPSIVYAGTNDGVFKSTNGGKTWVAINNGLNTLRVVALVMDPSTPSTLYVGVDNFFGGTNGVYKSTDGGDGWILRKTGMTNATLLSLAIDPVTPTTLYAGVSGGGIFKTTNGADNWAQTGNTPPFSPVSLSVDPHTPATVYAAEATGGIYRSIDAGVSWQLIGPNQSGPNAVFVGVSPHTAGLVFAITNSGGVFKSVDGGDTWTSVLVAHSGRIVFDPVSASTIYLQSFSQGLQRSTDGGQTWVRLDKGLPTPSAFALGINPSQTSILYVAGLTNNDQDAFVTKVNPTGSNLIYSTFLGGSIPPGDTSFDSNDTGMAIAIDSAGSAYVAGMATSPVFPTTPNSFQPLRRGFSDAFISKLTTSHIISGRVLEGGTTPLSGAEVVLTDGGSLTLVTTESDGVYEFSRLREGGSFTVSASKPHFTMAPASQSFSNLSSNQTLDFTATATNASFFTISGQVTNNGAGLAGVTVMLSGSQPGFRTTDSNGNYSFELAAGGNYTVTPSILGFAFGPVSQTFNNLSASQTANFTATRQSFVVTTTGNHGAGSLREAMTNANATPGTDTIVFNIPGPGVHVINLLNLLPEITETVVIDATTQPGYAGAPLVEINGAQAGSGSGLVIKAGGTTVRGLAIGRFSDSGIVVRSCNNNVIEGNYIGVDATGAAARNNVGINLFESSNNLIGGTTAAARNVVSGNLFDGISIFGSNNVIQGNFIGTDPAGTAAIPNTFNGVRISSAPSTSNLIGGTAPGTGNLISGNQIGIAIITGGNTIQGNLIGTDVTGTKKVPNLFGIDARAVQNTLIGGLTAGARNVISGNSFDGVTFSGAGSKLQGNYIGTDITGTVALGNTGSGVVAADSVLIGGTVPEARNIISANALTNGFGNIAVGTLGVGLPSTVQGNYIGTDATGSRSLGDSISGITIASSNNVIGGTDAAARNVISGNRTGILFGGSFFSPPQGNILQGNFIGLNAQGTGQVPNTLRGIQISEANNNTVGGTQTGAANKIAFNGGPGVVVTTGAGNSIRGNEIFSNAGLGIDLGAIAFPNTPNGLTPNDPNDTDSGPNNLQNFPVLTSVMSIGNSTTIQGSLNSTPNTTFHIDFYSSAALDPSGNGEGAQFLGTTSVTTDGSGNATINVSFPVALGTGRVVTATATDSIGSTSEFSAGDATGAAGSVQFSVSSIQVIEDVGVLNVTVLRSGGSAGTLTVDFATTGGTATAGQDYTATSGTLTFNGGETSKTLQIPILDNATTEPDETFTVTLRNTPSLDSLGVPNTLFVTVQDRTTVPVLSLPNAFVTEGGPGTTTDLVFTLNLSAATGRTVSVNFATSNLSAFGGASCSTRGVDYETKSGTVTIQPGTTSVQVPVRVCGDTSAETNETFLVTLSNPGTAALLGNAQALGGIFNDDVLELVLEESGPIPSQAATLDALLLTRDPFRIVGIPDFWVTGPDRNTRVVLFARNLELNPGELPSAVIVRIAGLNAEFFDVPAESVVPIHNFEFTQVVIRLPSNIPVGTRLVTIRAHSRVSNAGTIKVVP